MKAVTAGGTENGLKKEERHDRADSAYDKARTGTRAESQPPRKYPHYILSTRQNHSEEKSAGAKPERTPTGTERARQEKTCTSPPKTHTKESLEEARIDRK